MKSLARTLMQGALAAAMGLGVVAATAPTASAYVACNRYECWHTDTRVVLPGIRLTFHNDDWQRRHAHDRRVTWHERDADHDWRHGYWEHGSWHRM